MMNTFKDKSYWYNCYRYAVYPLLLEKVRSNDAENIKWDNALLDAFDTIAEKLFAPDEADELASK